MISQYLPQILIAARAIEFIAVCGGVIASGYAVIVWAVKNAKYADDIPKLRADFTNFTKSITDEIESLKKIINKSDGSTIADATHSIQHDLGVEKKNGKHYPSYTGIRCLS